MNLNELSTLDLNLLVVLAVVLEEVSVTRAARRLGRTQSAVSHALDRARVVLGDPIVARSGRGLCLTPKAASLVAPLGRVLGEVGEVLRGQDAFVPALATRRFTLHASDYHQIALLPALVARLGREAKGVVLHVKGPISDVVAGLGAGAADFAFVLGLDAFPELHARRIFSDRFVCLVREDHPAVTRGLDLATFVALPHVLVAPGGGRVGQVDEALAKRDLTRRVAVTLPHFSVAPRLLSGSDLVMTLPQRVARTLAAGSGLRVLEAPLPIPPIAVHAVWHERVHRDAGHLWMRGLLTEIGRALEASDPSPAREGTGGRAAGTSRRRSAKRGSARR